MKNFSFTSHNQNNDIEMVETAGVGVAMGNGTDEIKACANYITDTVQNDGFVKAVNKFVWEKENVGLHLLIIIRNQIAQFVLALKTLREKFNFIRLTLVSIAERLHILLVSCNVL